MNIGDVKNLVNALVLGADNMGQDTIVIKSNDSWSITKDIILECVSSHENVKLLYHEFRPDVMHSAYEPFLDWIKELYEESDCDTPEEFVEESQVYSLQREMICNYIKTDKCKRKEPIVIPEIDYDLKRLLGSITNILQYMADEGKILIVLEKIHYAGYSTIEYLSDLIQNEEVDNIALLCTYDNASGIPNYMAKKWDEFIDYVEQKNLGIAMYSEDTDGDYYNDKNYFVIKQDKYDEYYHKIKNMIETLAIEQSMYYLEHIYNKVKIEQADMDYENKMKLFKLSVIARVYGGQYQNALIICDDIRNLNNRNLRDEFDYNYLMCLAQIYNGQTVSAVLLTKKCQLIAEEMRDQDRLFHAKLMRGIALMRGFVNVIFELEGVSDYVTDEFLKEVEEREYYNHLAYFCIYAFEQQKECYEVENAERKLVYFNKGLEIIKKNENDKFLMGAYRKCAMFYSIVGNIDEVDRNYKKCIDVLRRLNGKAEEADIYNGLGYNRMIREDFEQANIYYNQALEIFYKICNPEMVSETFYNMSINALMAEDYRKACICITAAIQLLDNYGVYKPRVCHRAKLYGIAGLCNLKLGNGYRTQIYIEKIERIVRHILFPDGEPCYDMWDDELFYYYHIKALIYKREGKLEEAIKAFDNAEFHMRRSQGSMFVSYSMYAIEKAEILKELNRMDERKALLLDCMEFSKNIENDYTATRMKSLIADRRVKKSVFALDINVDIEDTLLMAKRLGAERELRVNKKNMEFLSNWQEMFLEEGIGTERLIERAMKTLQNNFGLNRLLFFDVEQNGKADIKYSSEGIPISTAVLDSIIRYFKGRGNSFVVSRVDSEFEEYKDIVSNFGMNTVVSIIGIPVFIKDELRTVFITYQIMHENFIGMEIMLDESDLNIFKFAFRQLMNEIYRANARAKIDDMNRELKAKNMMLENLAHTDNLTGLLNRQGFNKIVDEKLDTSGSTLGIEQYITVMYIDLDNFKYCNDNFGHDVGDMVLKEFSKMFTGIIGKSGYVVRYGGDEFVIVVENINKNYGEEVAEAIFEELDDNNAFRDKIVKSIGREVVIPENKRLACSIGIAVDKSHNVSMISELLKHADDALYKVKKSTKNNYSVWEKEGN